MRGNVTSFELDSTGIAEMLDGNLMPHPPKLLASIITITFVGIGDLPKSWLCTTFCIQWKKVATTLFWLKKWNPKYYGKIVISEARLNLLLEDNVPDEVITIVRKNKDVGAVDEEGASSYV